MGVLPHFIIHIVPTIAPFYKTPPKEVTRFFSFPKVFSIHASSNYMNSSIFVHMFHHSIIVDNLCGSFCNYMLSLNIINLSLNNNSFSSFPINNIWFISYPKNNNMSLRLNNGDMVVVMYGDISNLVHHLAHVISRHLSLIVNEGTWITT